MSIVTNMNNYELKEPMNPRGTLLYAKSKDSDSEVCVKKISFSMQSLATEALTNLKFFLQCPKNIHILRPLHICLTQD
jgi:hypothetical protein